ncbi:MAG: stage III sporulation protein AA [Lachnospiraceae bacterium]|nr:stage III sporulation protein AA [Lachnospiraceae bacterium]
MQNKEEIVRILPISIRKLFDENEIQYEYLQEIRFRVGQPVLLQYKNQEFPLKEKKEGKGISTYFFSKEEMKETMEYISNFSMYAFENEMRQGFLTIQGGHRIGIAGKVFVEQGRVKRITNIGMLNIRIAHEVIGCSKNIIEYLWEKDNFCHTLIISPPGGGKTTLLRDIIREIAGDRSRLTVGVVDERSEIAASYMGIPQNQLGSRCDVMDGCPKAEGLLMLLRSMAPDVIALDEIGGEEDLAALQQGRNCGCKILATIHGNSLEEIKKKPQMREFMDNQGFERYVILGNRLQTGTIREILDHAGKKVVQV